MLSSQKIPPGENAVALYRFDEESEGYYELVNVGINFSNNREILCRSIHCEEGDVMISQDPLTERTILADFGGVIKCLSFWTAMVESGFPWTNIPDLLKMGTTTVIGSNGNYNYQGIQGVPRTFMPERSLKCCGEMRA